MMKTLGQQIAVRKAIEECGELIVELAKLLAYTDGNHPSTTAKKPLQDKINDEFADVVACMRYLEETGVVDNAGYCRLDS